MSLTAVVSAVMAGLAVGYAVEEGRRLAAGRLFRLVGRAQARRRIFGSLLVAVLMVLVYVGLEVIDPRASPPRYVGLWGTVGALVLLLCGLAWLDLRDLRVHRERERDQELLAFAEALRSRVAPGTAPPEGQAPDPDAPGGVGRAGGGDG